MTHCHCVEQFLDGYRHGLGDAIRSLDDWANTLRLLGCPEVDLAPLAAIANSLRVTSASAHIEEHR